MDSAFEGRCASRGCTNTTREGKPYCSLHVMQHPYVQQVAAQIAAREAEIEAIAQGGKVDLCGEVVLDVLSLLKDYGGATVERVARERGVSYAVAYAVIHALADAGIVRLGRTSRGAIMAHLK